MSRSDRSEDDGDVTVQQSSGSTDRESPPEEDVPGWLAASTLRIGLAIVGIVLLLFALGQMVGMDLLGLAVEALNTSVGRWFVVAIFALIIIAVAMRGFSTWSE